MSLATVPAGLVQRLLVFAEARGASRAALLAVAPTNEMRLDDPEGRIDLDIYVAILRAAKELTGQPALALHFGAEVELAEFSVVGELVPPSGRALDGLEIANRFAPLLLDDSSSGTERFGLAERGGALWLIDKRPNPKASPELTESTFARIVTMLRRVGRSALVREVRVVHPDPGYAADYDSVFGVPVTFDCARNELQIDRTSFGLGQAGARYGYPLLREHAEALLAKLRHSRSLRSDVERLIARALPDDPIDIDTIAAHLGLGRQTLQRRLKLEQTTFEAIRDDIRHRLALHYFSSANASIAHTAWLLGFSDRAAFTRAFKRWTGLGPGQWRREASGTGS